MVFQGLATGSLLYVVFFEIMEKERKRAVSGLLQVRCVALSRRRQRAKIPHNFVARLLTHKSLQATCLALGYVFMVVLGFAESASD